MKHFAHGDVSFPPYFLQRSFCSTVDEALDRASLVSFDVFDTLLRRPFLEPTHLFDALGTFCGAVEFGRERRWAEAQARHRHAAARDVTLSQVYDQLHQPAELELAFEKSHIYPRAEIITWLSLARAKGKKVVAVSDMYLPKAFIAELLQMHRLPVDDLIVSSVDDVTKWDGTSFRLLSARHSVPFKDILHFGDNPHADYHAPLSLGIPSVLIANKLPRGADQNHLTQMLAALEVNGSHQSSTVGSLIRDTFVTNGPGRFWEDIGRYVVTPLMVGFAQWLDKEVRKTGCDRLAFAARDGKLPRDAFNALQGDKTIATPYAHLSRLVVLRAGLETRSEIVLFQLCSGVEAPVSDYIRRLGEGSEPLLQKARAHFGGDPIMGRDAKREDLVEFFHSAREELGAISSRARPLLYRYLEQLDLLRDPSKVAIADIGWGGTCASVLWDVVPETRNWSWLYFGTRKEYQPNAGKHRAMFFSYGVPWDHYTVVFDCVEITEFLFSAPETSTIGLRETSCGVEPVFAGEETQWEGWAPRVTAMAQGFAEVLPAFVRRIQHAHDLVIGQPTIFALLNHIVRTADPEVIREFGQLQHQLGFGASRYEPLLAADGIRYWRNIWRLLKGRSPKPGAGRLYWKNQTVGQFLSPLKGWKRSIALWALRQHAHGGLFKSRKRR
ncbi:MAG: hypothetical protein JSR89_06110 [Proteobacteria bacterium]|nr:hypothetical protein [Pseudomonadota bacterium]